MGSHSLLAMTSKRAEIAECIRLLEVRSRQRSGLAVSQLIESLRRRADRLEAVSTWNCKNQMRQSDRASPKFDRPKTQPERKGFSYHSGYVNFRGSCQGREFRAVRNLSSGPRPYKYALIPALTCLGPLTVRNGFEARIVYRRVRRSKDRVVERVFSFEAEFELYSRA